MISPRLLWIGSTKRAEFRRAANRVQRTAAVTVVGGLAAAARTIAASGPPDLMVLAQARPNQHTAQALERLRRLAPAARWIVLAGGWCEGELRSGQPVPGAARVYWHQWPAAWALAEEALAAGELPFWGQPATWQDDDRLLAACDAGTRLDGARIAVTSHDQAMRDLLRRTLAAFGGQMTVPGDPHPQVALWDARSLDDLHELYELRRQVGPTPIVVLAGFPRWQQLTELRAAGARAIVSKPFLLHELAWVVKQLADRCLDYRSSTPQVATAG